MIFAFYQAVLTFQSVCGMQMQRMVNGQFLRHWVLCKVTNMPSLELNFLTESAIENSFNQGLFTLTLTEAPLTYGPKRLTTKSKKKSRWKNGSRS